MGQGGHERTAPPAEGAANEAWDVLMLRALAVIVAEEHLRSRFLALTGYTPHDLVARAGRPDLRHAVADFLAGHEPDLRFVAARLGLEPRRLCAPC